MRTQVGIIGAGPAGLVLGELLNKVGVESVILENRSRSYVEGRVRAGVLEQGSIDILDAIGFTKRLHNEGLIHQGIYLQFNDERHHLNMSSYTNGKTIMVYGQQEVVRDLIEGRLSEGRPIIFEATADAISNIAGEVGGDLCEIHYTKDNQSFVLTCDVVIGADGFHGLSRNTMPEGFVSTAVQEYPFAWLGVLAQVAPSTDELIYGFSDRGFAMHSMRSPSVSRLYLQVPPDEDVAQWPSSRIWDELQRRLGTSDWTLTEGPISEVGITPMRSFVVSEMRYGRLFLAGDSGHIVPPTGAKGLNLAIADVTVLAGALRQWYQDKDLTLLESYSDRVLDRVWKVQYFSTSMTSLMHLDPTATPFERRLQRARQSYTLQSEAAKASLSENYVGLPIDEGSQSWIF